MRSLDCSRSGAVKFSLRLTVALSVVYHWRQNTSLFCFSNSSRYNHPSTVSARSNFISVDIKTNRNGGILLL